MNINDIWQHHSSNSTKVSLIVRMVYIILFVYSLLYNIPIKYLWTVICLDVLQYTYLALYYQINGWLKEAGVDIGHKSIYLIPSYFCYYAKVLVLLFIV